MIINEDSILDEELIAENAEFLRTLSEAKTVEEVKRICNEYSIEFSEDMWKDVNTDISEIVNFGELNEEQLDNVAGGKLNAKNLLTTGLAIAGIGATIATGSAVGIVAACVWIGYNGYKSFR